MSLPLCFCRFCCPSPFRRMRNNSLGKFNRSALLPPHVQYGHIGLLVCCSCGPPASRPSSLQLLPFCLQSSPLLYVVLLLNAFNIHHSSSFFHSAAAATNTDFSSSSNKERANCEHRKRENDCFGRTNRNQTSSTEANSEWRIERRVKNCQASILDSRKN